MKGAKEKQQDELAEVNAKFAQLRALYGGLKRTRREYPAVESIDWEQIPGGQVLVLRMAYPFEMVRVELADAQITELVNRAQGLTAGGVQIATPEDLAGLSEAELRKEPENGS